MPNGFGPQHTQTPDAIRLSFGDIARWVSLMIALVSVAMTIVSKIGRLEDKLTAVGRDLDVLIEKREMQERQLLDHEYRIKALETLGRGT